MPAETKVQRRAAAIAYHHPEKLNPENRGLLKMKRSELKKFASTRETGLRERARPRRNSSRRGGRRV